MATEKLVVVSGRAEASAVSDANETVASLFRDERLGLLRLATLLVFDRNLAEDIVQDAFIGLYRRWDRLVDQSRAVSYLRSSVINGARTAHRRHATLVKHLRVGDPTDGASADVSALLAGEHQEVIAAVRALPPRQREVVILRYWLDLSERDIASTLGVKPGTVKSTAARALVALERTLETQT